jgi:hypothetical protein
MRLMAVAFGLALAGTPAFAFQEQQVGGAPARGAAPQVDVAPPTVAPGPVEPRLPLGSAGGTEIRIPGLGKLGVIPKMDFGLELLYGASDSKRKLDERTEKDDQQPMIRGSIKHRF